ELGRTYPLVIGGKRVLMEQNFATINPANPSQVLGYFPQGTAAHVDQAVEVAAEAFERWRYTPVEDRAALLQTVARKMRERKHEFSATMVLEVGKSWAEADGDTAEAIDFLE